MNAPRRPRPAADLSSLFDELLTRVAKEVAERITSDTAGFYSAEDNPLGRRAFLDAARRGCFPAHKVGKRVFASRVEVDAWIATHGPPGSDETREKRAGEKKASKPKAVPPTEEERAFALDRQLATAGIGPKKAG